MQAPRLRGLITIVSMILLCGRLGQEFGNPMADLIKSYYLRLPAAMSRELRLHCVASGMTMNAAITVAVRQYLDGANVSASPGGREQ